MSALPILRFASSICVSRRYPAFAALYVAALLSGAAPGLAQPPSSDPLIAVVNGTDIRESDVRLADEEFGRNLPTQDPAARREQIITYLTDMLILAKAAAEQNMADETDLRHRMTFARNKGLMQQLLMATGQSAITEEAVRKAYEDAVVKVATEPELHLRAIVFRFPSLTDKAAVDAAEDNAKIAVKRINGGEEFTAVAAAMSEDSSAQANGGDLGYRVRAEMGKEYADVAFKLPIGGVSQPIKTQFGWHVIKVEDQRVRKPMDFDTVHNQLKALVARKAQLDLVAKLRAASTIERKDKQEPAEKPTAGITR